VSARSGRFVFDDRRIRYGKSQAPIVALYHRHDVDTDTRFSLLTSVVPATLLA